VSEVLLGHSYFLRLDLKSWEARQPYPPLGTLYAAGQLRSRGYEVAVFDAVLAESEAEWLRALERERPRFAVLFEDNFNYLSKMCLLRMREAAFTMLGMAKARGCTTLVSGSDATDQAEQYLSRGADYVLLGEGDETLLEVVERLAGRTDGPMQEVAGLAYVEPQDGGTLVRTHARALLKELDALPFPARDLVDISQYREIWQRHHGYFSMNVATSRGCPYHCNWCAKPIWGQRYHARSPEDVVAELDALRETYQPDHIWFADDILGLKPRWLARFADLLEARGGGIPFKCLSRADLLLRDGDIDALRRAGCQTVWLGAESGSQEVLDAMEKGTRVEQIREATRRLHASGIEAAYFLQFGYPGETREDISQTFRLVREEKPDDIGISVSYPLPGTKFYRAVQAELGTKRNWMDSGDLAMMFGGPFTTGFYRQLHAVLHREFRMRRAWRELWRALRRPRRLGRRHLEDAATALVHAAPLPLDLLRLERLARVRHEPTVLSAATLRPDEAARPSTQPD
jgi:anaerobic magnesium-protoporphyrin IX monomethyl ester cyclase